MFRLTRNAGGERLCTEGNGDAKAFRDSSNLSHECRFASYVPASAVVVPRKWAKEPCFGPRQEACLGMGIPLEGPAPLVIDRSKAHCAKTLATPLGAWRHRRKRPIGARLGPPIMRKTRLWISRRSQSDRPLSTFSFCFHLIFSAGQ
jgi:hypothetical protein